MTTSRRVPALLLAVVLAVVALSGVTTSTASASAGFARPKIGSCHQLSPKQLGAETDGKAPVRCGKGHDTVTIAAPIVKGLDYSDVNALLAAGAKACVPALAKAIGPEQDRKMSAYTYVFFFPTKAERAKGAAWVRCDVVKYAGTRPLPLPAKIHRLGKAPYGDALAKCLTATTTSYGPLSTPCSNKHAYRAKGTVRNPAKKSPSDRAWQRFAAKHCPKVVGSKNWYASWPYVYSWKAGERRMTCYAVTKR